MKTLVLLLLSAMVGIVFHIETSKPGSPSVPLTMTTDWPIAYQTSERGVREPCTPHSAALFAWMPVAEYFVTALVVRLYGPDPVFIAARRCG